MNQYQLALAITEWIRQNPDDYRVKELKQCTQQADQFKMFEEIVTK